MKLFFHVFISFTLIVGIMGNPYDESEVEEFMDLCSEFLDVCVECEQEWVSLEEEILESVETMTERILFTEQLILVEADNINEMAERIVETEQICADLVQTCSCDSSRKLFHEIKNSNQVVKEVEKVETLQLSWLDFQQQQQHQQVQRGDEDDDGGWERCAPMEQMNEVMNASIHLMEDLNSEMVAALSYLNYGMNELADDIVATECAIMNFSWQIGLMADQIVITEQMMADASEECCSDDTNLRNGAQKELVLSNYSDSPQGDWEPPEECDPYVNRTSTNNRNGILMYRKFPQDLIVSFKNMERLQHIFVSQFSDLLFQMPSTKTPKDANDVRFSDGPMPCDTWWNPPCCAMEMCADMVMVMMEMCADMASGMTEGVKTCIDQMLYMSDQILVTEGYIQDMGMEIHEMSDYIVQTEEMLLDFMTGFCEAIPWYFTSNFHEQKKKEPNMMRAVQLVHLLEKKKETLKKSLPTQNQKLQLLIQTIEIETQAVKMRGKKLNHLKSAFMDQNQDNVGDSVWKDMFDLMTQCMDTMMQFMTDQAGMVNLMVEEINYLSNSIVETEGYIMDMVGEINEMEGHIVQTEELMFSLIEDCMDE